MSSPSRLRRGLPQSSAGHWSGAQKYLSVSTLVLAFSIAGIPFLHSSGGQLDHPPPSLREMMSEFFEISRIPNNIPARDRGGSKGISSANEDEDSANREKFGMQKLYPIS